MRVTHVPSCRALLLVGAVTTAGCGRMWFAPVHDAGADVGLDASGVDAGEASDASRDAGTDAPVARCGTDERVASHVCVPCPAGTTNAAGDDPSLADTTCDDVCTVALGVACGQIPQGYLKAGNPGLDDQFGYSVAISGDTVVVGARHEDSDARGIDGDGANDRATDSGAVYVFTRTAGVWRQEAYLKSSNASAGDWFGYAVALDGDTLAVSGPQEDSAATGIDGDQGDETASNSGAVYVFERTGTTWTQTAYVKASNTGAGDFFGQSLALEGDTLVVGSVGEDSASVGVGGAQTNGATDSGAVYVFRRSGASWAEEAYIKASNTDAGDFFGWVLALEGDTLAVGARYEASAATGRDGDQLDDGASQAGAVYVFSRSGTVWTQTAYLKAPNTDAGDQFGYALALESDTLVVSAFAEDGGATGVGGDDTDDSITDSGAVYVFERAGGLWSQTAYLKASNTDAADFFGVSVGLSAGRLVVGAYYEDGATTGVGGDDRTRGAGRSGAAYLFSDTAGTWRQLAYVKATNTGDSDFFAYAVAMTADTLVVGALGEDSAASGVDGDQSSEGLHESGAVYVYRIAP